MTFLYVLVALVSLCLNSDQDMDTLTVAAWACVGLGVLFSFSLLQLVLLSYTDLQSAWTRSRAIVDEQGAVAARVYAEREAVRVQDEVANDCFKYVSVGALNTCLLVL